MILYHKSTRIEQSLFSPIPTLFSNLKLPQPSNEARRNIKLKDKYLKRKTLKVIGFEEDPLSVVIIYLNIC